MLDVCLIGTGGMMPLKNRWLTGLYLEADGKAALIDCGEGAQIALSCADIRISRIQSLFITHFHADHIAGLPGFLLSLGNSSRTSPLSIYAPKGGAKIINGLMTVCGVLPYEVRVYELDTSSVSHFCADRLSSMLEITAMPLKHRVDCLGYSFTLRRKPIFDPEKAHTLGVPVAEWSKLHSGKQVTLPNGKEISPDQVLSGQRAPIKVTYVTDTLPFDGIAELAADSDLFVCEGMYGDTTKKESMNLKRHMLMQDACRLAANAAAKRLWLTHYSPATPDPSVYEEELKALFSGVKICRDGEKISL